MSDKPKAMLVVGGGYRQAITDILIQQAYNSMLTYGERHHRNPKIGGLDATVERASPPPDSRQVRRYKERMGKR